MLQVVISWIKCEVFIGFIWIINVYQVVVVIVEVSCGVIVMVGYVGLQVIVIVEVVVVVQDIVIGVIIY